MPTVWLHASVVEATVVKALVAGSVAIVGAKPRGTTPAGTPGRAGLRRTLFRSGAWPNSAAGRASRRRMTRHPTDRRADALLGKPMAGFKMIWIRVLSVILSARARYSNDKVRMRCAKRLRAPSV